jgi:hypothetical protein
VLSPTAVQFAIKDLHPRPEVHFVASELRLLKPAVNRSARRGWKIATANGLELLGKQDL